MTYIAIVVQSLFDHIELPVFTWVISYPCGIKPVSIVTADVMVHLTSGNNSSAGHHQKPLQTSYKLPLQETNLSYQQVFKPLGTESPVQAQVFGEKAGYILASSV